MITTTGHRRKAQEKFMTESKKKRKERKKRKNTKKRDKFFSKIAYF